MQRFDFGQRNVLVAALLTLFLAPATAHAVTLFEGNVGTESHWLQVLGSTSMGERVYWYEVLGASSYQAQFASDAAFGDVVADFAAITTNYVAPRLGEGFYYFRVRAVGSGGVPTPWSRTGTLEVLEDVAAPRATIVSPAPGQTVSRGELLTIQLEVADDTVLRLAQFMIGGVYVGTVGLKTEDSKVVPSLDEPRIVSFDATIPSSGSLEISVVVSDVVNKTTTAVTTVNAANSGGGTSSQGKRRK